MKQAFQELKPYFDLLDNLVSIGILMDEECVRLNFKIKHWIQENEKQENLVNSGKHVSSLRK